MKTRLLRRALGVVLGVAGIAGPALLLLPVTLDAALGRMVAAVLMANLTGVAYGVWFGPVGDVVQSQPSREAVMAVVPGLTI